MNNLPPAPQEGGPQGSPAKPIPAGNMTIDELKALRASGRFHHATYRCHGTLWEGLWIYEVSGQLRGFLPAGFFSPAHPDYKQVEESLYGTGISLGAYGQG